MRRLALLSLIPFALACAAGGNEGQETFQTASLGDDAEGTGSGSESGDSTGADEVESSSSESDSSSSESSSSEDSSTDTTTTTTDGTTESSTGEPVCTRKRYTLNLNNDSWSSIPLDQAWTGANAPPCSVPIAGATHIADWGELIVIAEDEMVYRRLDGVWQPPVAWADSFGALVGENPTSMIHTPSLAEPSKATVFFSLDDGRAILYEYNQGGGIVFSEIVDLADQPRPGAPQASEISRWVCGLIDPSQAPDPDWLVWYMNYSDGALYTFNAALEWTSAPESNNDFFGTGQADEPTPAAIEAAFGDVKQGRAYFIGP